MSCYFSHIFNSQLFFRGLESSRNYIKNSWPYTFIRISMISIWGPYLLSRLWEHFSLVQLLKLYICWFLPHWTWLQKRFPKSSLYVRDLIQSSLQTQEEDKIFPALQIRKPGLWKLSNLSKCTRSVSVLLAVHGGLSYSTGAPQRSPPTSGAGCSEPVAPRVGLQPTQSKEATWWTYNHTQRLETSHMSSMQPWPT